MLRAQRSRCAPRSALVAEKFKKQEPEDGRLCLLAVMAVAGSGQEGVAPYEEGPT